MPAERRANAAFFAERQIVALADIVEAEHLHHNVVHRVLAGLDEGQAVMARIEMEEARDERMIVIIGQAEAENAAVKLHQLVDGLAAVDIEHHVAEAERAGAKAGDGAAGLEWLACGLGAVEKLQPIAERIVEDDQILERAARRQARGSRVRP